MLKLTTPDGTQIIHYEGWTRQKKDYQWVDGCSAKELAKARFRLVYLAPPNELMVLLSSPYSPSRQSLEQCQISTSEDNLWYSIAGKERYI